MIGSASTCQALTAASAPEDIHCKETVDTARVSGVVRTVWWVYSLGTFVLYECISV